MQPKEQDAFDRAEHQHEEEGKQAERHGVRSSPSCPRQAGDRCLCDDRIRTRSAITGDSLGGEIRSGPG